MNERSLIPIKRRLLSGGVLGCLIAIAAADTISGSAVSETAAIDPPHKHYGMGASASDASIAGKKRLGHYRGFLRMNIDLTGSLPPIGDQGLSNSGIAWAIAYAARSYYGAAREGLDVRVPQHEASPGYVYDMARHGGCYDDVPISDVIEILRQGALSLAQYPYRAECAHPAAALDTEAHDFRVQDFYIVDKSQIDDIKGQLERGNPVVVDFKVSDAFEELRGDRLFDEPDAPRRDEDKYQTLVIVGYDDERQAARIMNSWGSGWGDHGYAWISYQTLAARTSFAIVLDIGNSNVADPKPRGASLSKTISETETAVPKPETTAPIQDAPKAPEPQSPAEPSTKTMRAETPPATTTLRQVFPPANLLSSATPPPNEAVAAKETIPQADAKPHELKDLQSLECGNVKRIQAHGHVTLSGFVASEEDLSAVKALAAKNANTDVGEIYVAPWPLCEALDTLDKALAAQDRPSITTSPAESAKEGDTLQISLRSPMKPSYVYMSYFQADRTVLTMVQPNAALPQPTASNHMLTFGDGKDGRAHFTVGAPFGTEMIVVVASASPLFASELPRQQSERDYLSMLRKALLYKPAPNLPDRQVTAAIHVLKTEPR